SQPYVTDVCQVADISERAVGKPEDLLAAFEHEETGRGEPGPAAAPRRELGADEAIQILEVVVDGRLAPPEADGGSRDRSLGGHRAEGLELTKINHVGSRNS